MKAKHLGHLVVAQIMVTLLLAALPGVAGAAAAEQGALSAEPLGLLAVQQARLTAADGAPRDFFGYSVAISGDAALVGMPFEGDSSGPGAAYVFVRSGDSWSQQAELLAADRAPYDWFGCAVALAGDTAVVGARRDTVGGNAEQGSAYVFTRSGASWTQQAQLTASDGAAGGSFGQAVSLSGETALIGAGGSAYVFTRSGASWSEQAKLMASDGAGIGFSVAVSGDTALAGAPHSQEGGNVDQGSAYVFTRSGASWRQQAKLVASDGAEGDCFGWAVAVSGDTALVGPQFHTVGANTNQGSAYVFTRSGASWTQQAQLTASDGAAYAQLGMSVALSGDTALVGAPWDGGWGVPSAAHGAAYVFARAGSSWTQQDKLTVSDGAGGDWLGYAVGLSGATALVGAPHDDVGAPLANVDQGSAAAFMLDGTPPTTTPACDPLPNAAGWNKGPVTVTLTGADEGGSGVAQTFYRLGDAGDFTQYAAAAKPAITANGSTRVWYYSTDAAGNAETPKSRIVRLDTTKPVTRALANATVYRGRRATLKLRVIDAFSPKATVTVKIYRRGVLKKTLKLGLRSTNVEVRYTGYTCWLARGSYIWKVYATDLAGNTQKLPVGYRTLTVR